MKYSLILGATLLLFLSSCTTLVPYSKDISSELEMSEEQLKQVQFYISQTVVLERQVDDVKAYTQNGTLIVEDDSSVDRVIINQGTPGTVVKKSEGRLFVSFEEDPNRYLVFGYGEDSKQYMLQAENWEDGKGKIHYGSGVYYSTFGSGNAHLLMQVKAKRNGQGTTRVASGRKL